MRVLDFTLFELINAIKNGDLSWEDVMDEYKIRIDRLDDDLKAYITINENIDKVNLNTPLAGVPLAIKDNICTRGLRTTCGSRILENYIPPYDATVVTKLKEAGAVILGKTNMDEFAMGSSTENSAFFPSKNPWDKSRVPGGSSGGSAVAVAAREAIAALGSDTGGSIRCPASFCGIVGLKPTYGLVSRFGLIAFANSLEQIGPMTRDVRDCALLMNIIAGYDEMDGTSINKECENYLTYLNMDVKNMRMGVLKEFFGEGTEEGVKKEVWNAIHVLENLGMKYKEVSLPTIKYALPAYYLIAMSEASSNLARYDGIRYGVRIDDEGLDWSKAYSKTRSLFGKEVKRRILLGTFALSAGYYEDYYLKALKVRTLIKRDFERLFKEFDVLVGPTMPTVAFKIGEKIEDPLEMYMMDVDTVPVNLAGIPAISVPCGFSNGLPIGFQIIAPPLMEGRLIAVARKLEEELNLNLNPPL
ncbi:MAG: Asp-tRNA(Asn)/Glu-tRNA(Gln) amidotransferase subunit GatA [Candidatus Methanomethyliaceae archaeon]|nr:Asp-tRNA(Asn)/Glu-tRNA(Gln) amidotransferase subunit GatA [Candidatus Methanomethyliaceae archaeon]MDW7970813.1 Asp-tRNA(Asn)/Glu-tRNA(Gln) amidotransferase subunit GatA [Nitrososphaerota archaeon]